MKSGGAGDARRASPAVRLPVAFKLLWAGTVVNRIGLLIPAFLVLFVVRQRLGTSVEAASLVAVQGAGAVIASFVGGVLADRLGARRCIVASQLLNAVVAICLSAIRWMPAFTLLVFLAGCLSTIHRPAGAAMIARTVDPRAAGRAYGLLYWATNIGSSIAPVLAGVALTVFPPGLFLLNAVTALTYAAIATRLPADAGRAAGAAAGERPPRWAALRPFITMPMSVFLVLSLALALVYMQRQSALPLDMAANGLTPSKIGTALAINGLLVVALQPIASRLSARLPMLWMFLIASVLIAVGFGLNAIVHSFPGYLAAITIWTLGEIALAPATGAYIARHGPADQQGSFQGSYLFMWNLGLSAGAPLGAWLLEITGSRLLWVGTCALGLAAGAGHIALSRRYPYDLPTRTEPPGHPDRASDPS
ncbi:MAG TPA: MFS transporter [Streptosporangiaceae bacterium]|jgi:MFS family permease